MRLDNVGDGCLVKIETDAGISGYGEAGLPSAAARERISVLLPLMIGQDPLAIERHFYMLASTQYSFMANTPTISGIDIALWDLAGKMIGLPIYRLIGGPIFCDFRAVSDQDPATTGSCFGRGPREADRVPEDAGGKGSRDDRDGRIRDERDGLRHPGRKHENRRWCAGHGGPPAGESYAVVDTCGYVSGAVCGVLRQSGRDVQLDAEVSISEARGLNGRPGAQSPELNTTCPCRFTPITTSSNVPVSLALLLLKQRYIAARLRCRRTRGRVR
jgi:hypothetical protein